MGHRIDNVVFCMPAFRKLISTRNNLNRFYVISVCCYAKYSTAFTEFVFLFPFERWQYQGLFRLNEITTYFSYKIVSFSIYIHLISFAILSMAYATKFYWFSSKISFSRWDTSRTVLLIGKHVEVPNKKKCVLHSMESC